MLSRRSAPLLFLGLASITACGSRSALPGADDPSAEGGAGGSTTTTGAGGQSTSTTTTTTSSTETTPFCSFLAVQPTLVINPDAPARKPQLAFFKTKTDVLLASIATAPADDWLTFGSLSDPWSVWPPTSLTELGGVISFVNDYAMTTGPNGPLAVAGTGLAGTSPTLIDFDGFSFSLDAFVTLSPSDFLYIAGIEGRTLAGQANSVGGYEALQTGSHQPGGLPQSEQPYVCTQAPLLAAAVPAGSGFLSAVTEAEDPADNCQLMAPAKATRLALMRYESPKEPGSFLQLSDGDSFTDGEPVHLLAMTPTTFGAWVVFQRDGSTSEQMPPVQAVPVDMKGHLLPQAPGPFPVSPDGVSYPFIAAATLGDDLLAAAHVDTLDPSAPTIVIQLAHVDGSLGPAIVIPTNDAWLTGRFEMLVSPNKDSLLLAWESAQTAQRIAIARADCLNL